MTRQKQAYLYGLVTVILWSTVGSACKVSLRYITPAELVFYSSVTSCLVLLVVLCVQRKVQLIGQMRGGDWGLSLRLGMLNPFLYYLILFEAYNLLPAQQAQPINYTWAITLSLLSVPLLGQKLSSRQLLAICTSYCGVLIISTGGNLLSLEFDSPLGVGLALLSTLFWALYWIYNTRDRRDPTAGLFMNFLMATPWICIYLMTTEGLRVPDWRGLAGAVYLGFFEMGLSFLFWLMAMKLTDNTARIANLIFLAPILSLVFIGLVVGEEIRLATVLGLVFILVGLFVQKRSA